MITIKRPTHGRGVGSSSFLGSKNGRCAIHFDHHLIDLKTGVWKDLRHTSAANEHPAPSQLLSLIGGRLMEILLHPCQTFCSCVYKTSHLHSQKQLKAKALERYHHCDVILLKL